MRSRKWKAEDGRWKTDGRRQRAAEKKRLSEAENFSFCLSAFGDIFIE